MEKLKILNLNFSFQRAAHYHINGGMLLMGVVLLAMFLANSPWGDIYASFWNYEVHLQIGEFNFFSHNGHHMTLMTFINDALMAVFFFSVGLEIKREILVGELSSFRQALLPIVAACGGMLVIMARLQMVEELDVVDLGLFQVCWGVMQSLGMEI